MMMKLTEIIDIKATSLGAIFISTISLAVSSPAQAFFSFGGNSEDFGTTNISFDLNLDSNDQFNTGFYEDVVENFEQISWLASNDFNDDSQTIRQIARIYNQPNQTFDLTISNSGISPNFLEYSIDISQALTQSGTQDNSSSPSVINITDTPYPGFPVVDGVISFNVSTSLDLEDQEPFDNAIRGSFQYSDGFQNELGGSTSILFNAPEIEDTENPTIIPEPGTSVGVLVLGIVSSAMLLKRKVKNI